MKNFWGKILLGVAFVTCPCHLPVYLLLFGGTALGTYLAQYQGRALILLALLFSLSLVSGWRLGRMDKEPGR
ncbi:MAG: mercury resistance protein [bacterium]|nr:mercury resistance protein [bacterium]